MGQDEEQIGAFQGEIVCEAPNNLLNKFEGTLVWNNKRFDFSTRPFFIGIS
jgi:phospholipid-translocating ATPase